MLMDNLEKKLKKHFSVITNHLIAVCMLLGLGFTGSQAQAQEALFANFYFQVGDEITNEITAQPGDTITVINGVVTKAPLDGVTLTLLWDPSLVLGIGPNDKAVDLTGGIWDFEMAPNGMEIDNDWSTNPDVAIAGHVTTTQVMLFQPALPPNYDADGNAILTYVEFISVQFVVNADIDTDTDEVGS